MNNDKSAKLSSNKQKKQKIVAEIAEKAAKAKAIVFTNYQGLTHNQLEEFKKEIKKADAEFAVTKNTLLEIALEQAKNKELKTEKKEEFHGQTPILSGQTGTLFLNGDIVAPLKALAKMIKDLQKPEIKFGLLEGKTLTAQDVIKLATLPSREQLITQLVGLMKSPIFGLHRSLQWNIQKMVLTLKAIEKKKS